MDPQKEIPYIIRVATSLNLLTVKTQPIVKPKEIVDVPSELSKFAIFKHIDLWPQKTSLACWNCEDEITLVPYAMPKCFNAHPSDYMYEFECEGVMCSLGCVGRYIIEHYSENANKYLDLSKLLNIAMTGKMIKILDMSPSRFKLTKYGGTMTREEMRKQISEINQNGVHINMYPNKTEGGIWSIYKPEKINKTVVQEFVKYSVDRNAPIVIPPHIPNTTDIDSLTTDQLLELFNQE